MNNDRKLLELAAKAWFGNHPHCWNDPVYAYEGGEKIKEGGFWDYATNGELWNPLTDDGDALRLAVKLHMQVDVDDRAAEVLTFHHRIVETTDGALDEYAATRRAIVRAAAEIGRSMQGT